VSGSRPSVVVGIAGPPGTELGTSVLDALAGLGVDTHLVVTAAAEQSLAAATVPAASYGYAIANQGARISSGSFRTGGMVVAPCDPATATAISMGLSRNLLERAADVTIKERRPLVLLIVEPAGVDLVELDRRFEGTRTELVRADVDPAGAVARALAHLVVECPNAG
jgi:flavin prenyltransferase